MGKFLGIDWRKAAEIAAPIAVAFDPTGVSTKVLNTLSKSRKVDASLVRRVANDSGSRAIQIGSDVALGGLTLAEPYLNQLASSQFKSQAYVKQADAAHQRVAEQYELLKDELEQKRRRAQDAGSYLEEENRGLRRRLQELGPHSDPTQGRFKQSSDYYGDYSIRDNARRF